MDAWLEELATDEFADFNLIYGDAAAVHVAYGRGSDVELMALPPGVHVLTNDRMGSPDMPKEGRARGIAETLANLERDALFEGLELLLADARAPAVEELPPPPEGARFDRDLIARLQAICVHTPLYGTGSATLLAGDSKAMLDHRFAAGPPDQVPFVDVSTEYR